MKIYSWNVNGIRAAQRKGFIDWLKEDEPDVICLQEIKAKVEQLDEELLNIEGYKSYFNPAERKGYSGVAIYSKIQPKSVQKGIGIEKFDKEGRVLITEYDEFTLLNIYFPNGQRDDERLKYKLEFCDELLKYCNKLKNSGRKLIICGDYNTAHKEIDLKNPKSNKKRSGFLPIEREWIDKFIDNGYIDTYRKFHPDEVKYSWWSYRFKAREKGVGWRIDYHFVSENFIDKINGADILDDVMGSDHCPVAIYL